jgi:sulfur carrier protein ThiS
MTYCDALRKVDKMARSTTSVRLADDLRQHLAAVAADEGTTMTDLIERFVREGLASAEHPGIVFKPGPSGRRAALAGGPDIWEIVSGLRHTSGTETQKIAALAEEFGIHQRQVVIALNYAAAHRDEVEERVTANDRALQEAERVAAERQRLLA